MRQSAAVAAGFILLNSIGGLAGYMVSGQSWPPGSGWMLLAAFAGCLLGAEIASHRRNPGNPAQITCRGAANCRGQDDLYCLLVSTLLLP